MDRTSRISRKGLVAAAATAILALAIIAFVFDLGPFAEGELSEAEFLARGDEICAQAHEEFLDIQGSTPRTAGDAEAQVEALIEVAEEERDALADLTPPASLASDLKRYVAARQEGIDVLREGLSAARRDEPSAYEAAQAKLASQQADRQRTARRLGFRECSEPLIGDEELERQAQPPTGG